MSSLSYKRPVILGIFVVLGLFLIVLAVFTVGSQRKIFSRTLQVRVDFDDVEGLQAGNNVWLSGVKVGTVKKWAFIANNRVEVWLDIDRTARSHIYKNARAKISSDGLIGNRIVVLFGGTDSAGPVVPGDVLESVRTLNTEDMLATLQENNKNLLEITGRFKEIGKKIDDGNGTIGVLLNDAALAADWRRARAQLQAASRNGELATANIRQFSTGLNRQGGLANELLNDTTVFRQLQQTVNELAEASGKASAFVGTMQRAAGQLNRDDNPAGMLLQDQAAASDLRVAISHLRSSSERLDEDLEALQHNFLLRGFFKKKAKAAAAAKKAANAEQ
jgi:phospholipid/cholesterol/gamma-HCH transport system substrate-binding protein